MKKQALITRILLIAVVAQLTNTCIAQNAPAANGNNFSFTLQQAITYAMQNQSRIQNAELDEQIAKARVHETGGIGLPQISGSVDAKDFIDLPTNVIPGQFFGGPPGSLIPVKFGTQYNATAGIEVSQMIFSSSYLVGMMATKTFLQLSQKATQRTKTEAAAAVTKAYYSVLVNNERMKLIEANVARIKKLADDTKRLNEQGFVEKIDLDRITVAYNNLNIEKEKVQRLVELGSLLLKYQMGMDLSSTLTLTDNLSDIKFQAENTIGDKFSYSSRVEYSLMESQRRIAQLTLRKDKLEYLPNIIFYGAGSMNALRNEINFFDSDKKWYPTTIVGLRIGIPIFDGLQKNYRIQQSKLSLIKAENDLKFMQQTIDLDLANTRTMLRNASESLGTQQKNIELAEEVYRTSKLKYEQGVGSNLEVLNAETALKEAQTNYFSALFDALIAKTDYEKANGTLIK